MYNRKKILPVILILALGKTNAFFGIRKWKPGFSIDELKFYILSENGQKVLADKSKYVMSEQPDSREYLFFYRFNPGVKCVKVMHRDEEIWDATKDYPYGIPSKDFIPKEEETYACGVTMDITQFYIHIGLYDGRYINIGRVPGEDRWEVLKIDDTQWKKELEEHKAMLRAFKQSDIQIFTSTCKDEWITSPVSLNNPSHYTVRKRGDPPSRYWFHFKDGICLNEVRFQGATVWKYELDKFGPNYPNKMLYSLHVNNVLTLYWPKTYTRTYISYDDGWRFNKSQIFALEEDENEDSKTSTSEVLEKDSLVDSKTDTLVKPTRAYSLSELTIIDWVIISVVSILFLILIFGSIFLYKKRLDRLNKLTSNVVGIV